MILPEVDLPKEERFRADIWLGDAGVAAAHDNTLIMGLYDEL